MLERKERVKSPGKHVTDRVSRGHFCLSRCSFGPLSCAHLLERCGMPFHDAVWTTLKGARVSSIWAKECM